MRAFILSDIKSPLDQVTALPLLLETDSSNYYDRLMKQVQDDWFELMCVLGQQLDCTSPRTSVSVGNLDAARERVLSSCRVSNRCHQVEGQHQ